MFLSTDLSLLQSKRERGGRERGERLLLLKRKEHFTDYLSIVSLAVGQVKSEANHREMNFQIEGKLLSLSTTNEIE